MCTLETHSPHVVQTVLGDVGLEVSGPADGPALGAGVGRFVLIVSLVRSVTALVGRQCKSFVHLYLQPAGNGWSAMSHPGKLCYTPNISDCAYRAWRGLHPEAWLE